MIHYHAFDPVTPPSRVRANRLAHAHARAWRLIALRGRTPARVSRVERLSILWRAAHKQACEMAAYLAAR